MQFYRRILAGSLLLVLLGACGGGSATNTTAAASSDGNEGATTEATGEGESRDWYADLDGRTLNVVSWGGVWTESSQEFLFDPFSEETGVNVNFVVSGTDPTATVKLQVEQGNVQIDLTDSSTAARLEHEGQVEHFPQDLIEHLEEHSREGTVLPYVLEYGSTATLIVCNPDLVEKCPTNAEEFWNVEEFPGDRAIAASYSSALGFAAMAAGADGDNLYPIDIDAAIAKLEEIKPHIKVWPDSGAMQEQVMIDREVGIAYMWNGRAHVVKRDHMPQLEFYWDNSTVSSGGGFAVPKGAANADVAYAFLHWLAEHPEAQASWVENLTYPMPHKDLLDLIPEEIANSLPAAHNPAVIEGIPLAEQDAELQEAWQSFIAGTG